MYKRQGQGRRAALTQALAFVGVALPLAALFLACNQAQTGSPWVTGYHAAIRYARDNDFRYFFFAPEYTKGEGFLYFFVDRSPLLAVGRAVMALFRLNVDAFGWPLGLLLACLARSAPARWLAASLAGLWVVHLPLADAGIDTFGPVHYAEAMLPLVLLTTDGLRTLWRWAWALGRPGLVPGAVGGLFVVCAAMYLPPRWGTLLRLARDIRGPTELVEREVSGRAVIFTGRPFAPACGGAPSRHFVLLRPNNSPDLDEDVLWVNHVSLARDREFARRYERPGLLLTVSRKDCQLRLVPLEEATEEQFPPAVAERPSDFPPPSP
ncbi:hypothetical protein D7X12_12100 [Corallococcus sicarius]|uniref:Glycosyltransferase RgtA/B/C/D-like domain-containing protein n=1 Tax=Corallococcus sicarius TaxID=2316726 RepID=A0A3A8NJU6_9BACT|nr:hypothetical protein D7X12_12100 [Corallococcus sicarius]